MEGIFGVIGIIAGVYCLYAWWRMGRTGEIPQSIFLAKGEDMRACKDREGFTKAVSAKLLILGIVVLLYGLCDLYQTYVKSLGVVFMIVLIVFFAVLVWFAVSTRKIKERYF